MRRPVVFVIVAAMVGAGSLSVTVAGPALAAGGELTWSQVQPVTNPPHDYGASAVFDDATGQLVLAGGSSGTWTWDGANWTQQHPASSPPNRQSAAMAYDGATKQVVLFGGDLVHSTPVVPSDAATDTWTWNGVTWTQQHPVIVPPYGRTCAAYDPDTQQFLMFDIEQANGHPATWNWTGTNWVQRTVDAGPLGGCSMAYDPDQHAMLLLDADPNAGVAAGMAVWSWDGANWVRTSMTLPIAQAAVGSLAYDADAGGMVADVVVITSPPPYFSPASELQTWLLAGGSWSRVAGTTPVATVPLVYDSATHQLVAVDASPESWAVPTSTWIYGSTTGSTVLPTRVFGTDRESTAVAVSQSAFAADGTAPAVVLAREDAFPDALAGGPLAAAKHGPLLLTASGSLDAVTKTEIQRVLKPGGTVFLLGGTAALSASVSTAVVALGFGAVRISGSDRF
ncbi:MAG: large repetitive protein, partial [Actinomycetota bacterium]|nr:large repetitive protein [Actinomycetota bacterium]